jgi:hypothetical protein
MTGRSCGRILLLAACPLLVLAAPESHAAQAGRIQGRIVPAGAVKRVCAIDRNVKTPLIATEVPLKEIEGALVDGGKRFRIDVTPGEYDLHFELHDGSMIEGADTRVEAEGEPRPLREKDISAITKRISTIRTFENEKTVLEIAGNRDLARAVVKLVRTNPTSYDGEFGEPIAVFRWEVWELRNRTGSWVRERTVRVLRRFLIAKRTMSDMKWEFRGALGGVSVGRGQTVERDLELVAPAGAQTKVEAETATNPGSK